MSGRAGLVVGFVAGVVVGIVGGMAVGMSIVSKMQLPFMAMETARQGNVYQSLYQTLEQGDVAGAQQKLVTEMRAVVGFLDNLEKESPSPVMPEDEMMSLAESTSERLESFLQDVEAGQHQQVSGAVASDGEAGAEEAGEAQTAATGD
jgi:hypothetical protein